MIPLRVYVKGFMSYRDAAELSFDGSSLWMLTGCNGAGKSAIFDAMTFALYGVHRLGKQKAKELINHQSDNLVVEFDFAIDTAIYRVKRTVQRKGRPSFQAFCLDKTGKPSPIAETDVEEGLKTWLNRLLGIDEKAFTRAVILQQGKSDALLEAQPEEKYRILSQLIDLSAYKKLYEQADELQKQHKQSAASSQRQLQQIEPVNEDQITVLEHTIAQAKDTLKQLQARLERLTELKVYAKRWVSLCGEQQTIEQDIRAAQNLFAQAEQIERDAARLNELQQVLPTIIAVFDERDRLVSIEKCITDGEQAIKQWEHEFQQATESVNGAKKRFENLQDEQTGCQKQSNDVLQKLTELAPHLSKLEEIERLRKDTQLRRQQLAQFPEDLDEQILQQQAHVEELQRLQVALPLLKQFARARSDWNDTYIQLAAAQKEIAQLTARLQELQRQHDDLQSNVEVAGSQVGQMQSEVTRAETLCKEVDSHIKRFYQVAELPNCSYCGQPLTPEHLSKEQMRLEEERSTAELHLKDVLQRQQQATEQHNALDKALKQMEATISALTKEVNKAERQHTLAEQRQRFAIEQATQALHELPAAYRSTIQPDATMPVTDCLSRTYPSPVELTAMERRRSSLDEYKSELETLDKRRRERDKQRAALEPLLSKLDGLIEQYSEQRCNEIRERQRIAKERRDTVEQRLKTLSESLQNEKNALTQAEQAKSEANQECQRANNEVQQNKVRKQEIERTIESRISELPTLWQEAVRVATHVDLETWQTEAKRLTGADTLHAQLIDAQRKQINREQRLNQIVQELHNVPEEAQQSLDNLEQHEQIIRQKQTEVDKQRSDTEGEKHQLEHRRKQRCELEAYYKEAARGADLYKELAGFLGKDNLQGYLLIQAEEAIVAYANEILDRISGGSLSLELRQRADDSAGIEAVKAFDLVAINSETGHEPMPVDLLSGGQRFRVAVSLALAIGKYASQDNRSIEAVIIDEGFGSLDQQGRREIIDQLHVLSQTLRRIILVSHQEEFANEFPNRYAIELSDGTSRISLAN